MALYPREEPNAVPTSNYFKFLKVEGGKQRTVEFPPRRILGRPSQVRTIQNEGWHRERLEPRSPTL